MNSETEPFFNAIEARVIACLMEKQLTTPNNYPLSLNSLLLACNQKSNREPVMNLTEGQLGHAVNELESRGLVGVDYGGRANHVTHRVMTEFDLDQQRQAILAVLMVRSPLTLNDIKTKTGRMADFADVNQLRDSLYQLIERDEPLVIRMPKGPGSREDRYTHLLCGEVKVTEVTVNPSRRTTPASDELTALQDRVEALEAKVRELQRLLD